MEKFSCIYDKYFNMVWHICLIFIRNTQGVQDSVQETFLRYANYVKRNPDAFIDDQSDRRRMAWLVVTAGKVCRDQMKVWWHDYEAFDLYENQLDTGEFQNDMMLEAVINLPVKYKIPVYLYYYQGFESTEIAKLLHRPKLLIMHYLEQSGDLIQRDMELEFRERSMQNEGAY